MSPSDSQALLAKVPADGSSACGSGGIFVQSEKFVESHGSKLGNISIYGQESDPTTLRLAVMNLALRGIEADSGPEHADTFRRDTYPDLRGDYALANPPFKDSDTTLRTSASLHSRGKIQAIAERNGNYRNDDDVRSQSRNSARSSQPLSVNCND